jgi:hypothetical protein
MKPLSVPVLLLISACSLPGLRGAEVEGLDGSLRLNQVQYIGTHNSYHIAPGDAVALQMLGAGYSESKEWPAARLIQATDYTHPALAIQLRLGLRLFELDVHDDPEGGRFSHPKFLRLIEQAPLKLPVGTGGMGDLRQPGFKVLHHGEWDFRSTNYLLTNCLREIDTWSNDHPGHLPIIIQIEAKESAAPIAADGSPTAPKRAFDAGAWKRLEASIRSTIPAAKLFTPDHLRGDQANLKTALAAKGWPTLEVLKGKFLFLLLNKKDLSLSYLELDPLLRDRIFFVSLTPDHPSATWFRVPDPFFDGLPRMIDVGFLATTLADHGTLQARNDDVKDREQAFRSGAQFILTDYALPDRRFSNYQVSFPGGIYVRGKFSRRDK